MPLPWLSSSGLRQMERGLYEIQRAPLYSRGALQRNHSPPTPPPPPWYTVVRPLQGVSILIPRCTDHEGKALSIIHLALHILCTPADVLNSHSRSLQGRLPSLYGSIALWLV